MELHWGWLIGIYLFLGGLGAGAYLTSFAAEKGVLGDAASLKKVGYYIASPVVAFGALLLVFDLGQGLRKPWLILGMFLNLRSVMTWGIYILSAFILVGLIRAYYAWKNKKSPQALTWLGAILALATGSYTGMLLAVVEAVPFWNTILTPVLFVLSALSTGLSATSLLAHFMEKGELKEGRLCQAHLVLVLAEIIVLGLFIQRAASGVRGMAAQESAAKLISGSLAVPFWVILVALGLVGPFFLYAVNARKQRPRLQIQTNPPTLAEQEQAAAKLHHVGAAPAICACDAAVMLGSLSLRCLFVFAAVPIWNLTLG